MHVYCQDTLKGKLIKDDDGNQQCLTYTGNAFLKTDGSLQSAAQCPGGCAIWKICATKDETEVCEKNQHLELVMLLVIIGASVLIFILCILISCCCYKRMDDHFVRM